MLSYFTDNGDNCLIQVTVVLTQICLICSDMNSDYLKKCLKDTGMVVSSTDSWSASNHAVASFLVPDIDWKKLSNYNLLLLNSGLPHSAGTILV